MKCFLYNGQHIQEHFLVDELVCSPLLCRIRRNKGLDYGVMLVYNGLPYGSNKLNTSLAQLAEHRIPNPAVQGSSPWWRAKLVVKNIPV